MWTRQQVKGKGRLSVQANYWKAVLVALVLAFVAGGIGAGGAGSSAALPGIAVTAYVPEGVTSTSNEQFFGDGMAFLPPAFDELGIDAEALQEQLREQGVDADSLEEAFGELGIDAQAFDDPDVSIGASGIDVQGSDGSSVHIDAGGLHVESASGASVDIDGEVFDGLADAFASLGFQGEGTGDAR